MKVQERTGPAPLSEVERQAMTDVMKEYLDQRLRQNLAIAGRQKGRRSPQKRGLIYVKTSSRGYNLAAFHFGKI